VLLVLARIEGLVGGNPVTQFAQVVSGGDSVITEAPARRPPIRPGRYWSELALAGAGEVGGAREATGSAEFLSRKPIYQELHPYVRPTRKPSGQVEIVHRPPVWHMRTPTSMVSWVS
jgi:hypothetical protein